MQIREDEGEYVVAVRDLPAVVTAGDSFDEALELAADAIEVVIAAHMARDLDIVSPSAIRHGEHAVALPAPLAAKASVYAAWKASGLSKSELARRLGRSETEVRRILDPGHGTKLDQLDEAARALGGRLAVSFADAA
ncbi:MAG TPA: type II toxin-antitoxin system HicB family antitoxin [Hyphomicrobiales bacterium]|nr:type II toxin-antitoxin system HicB family antitoxin [Hyphomicrobiales bacterium]